MALRLQERYKINHLCTDGNKVYGYYKISNKHHITKKETALVESWNCRLRYYLARLKRKTLCYNKSNEMLRLSILMLINREEVLFIV